MTEKEQWTDERWKEQERKFENIPINSNNLVDYRNYLEETRSQEEHPEWYDSPCLCQLCCSYGD